ncbi:MAG: hypothetical protein KAG61_08335 [Bacteriovoracaceae bacterium]|nr:hypothetical protein [Bacteriovoracaceae bacterium]
MNKTKISLLLSIIISSAISIFFNSYMVQDGANLFIRAVTMDHMLQLVDYSRWGRIIFYYPPRFISYFTSNHRILSYSFALPFILINLFSFIYILRRIDDKFKLYLFFLSSQISFVFQRLIGTKAIIPALIWLYWFIPSRGTRLFLSFLFSITHVFLLPPCVVFTFFQLKDKKIKQYDVYDFLFLIPPFIGFFNFIVFNSFVVEEALRGFELIGTSYAWHVYFSFLLMGFSLLCPKDILVKPFVLHFVLLFPLLAITSVFIQYNYGLHCIYREFKVPYFIISMTYFLIFLRVCGERVTLPYLKGSITFSILVLCFVVGANSFVHYTNWTKVLDKVSGDSRSCWSPLDLNMIATFASKKFWGCYEMSSDTAVQFLLETNQNTVTTVLNTNYNEISCDELVAEQKFNLLFEPHVPYEFLFNSILDFSTIDSRQTESR